MGSSLSLSSEPFVVRAPSAYVSAHCQAPFGTFTFVPNGTCQVAYQTVAHLASGGRDWTPLDKYPAKLGARTSQVAYQTVGHLGSTRKALLPTDVAPAELNHLQSNLDRQASSESASERISNGQKCPFGTNRNVPNGPNGPSPVVQSRALEPVTGRPGFLLLSPALPFHGFAKHRET